MNIMSFVTDRLSALPQGLIRPLETNLQRLPFVQQAMEKEYAELMASLEAELKPYAGTFTAYSRLPEGGRSRENVLEEMQALQAREENAWREGYVSGAVYHGDPGHLQFLSETYALHSQANPLHANIWPSATKFEAEIVAMTADMLGARHTLEEVVGTVSSGGTESILLAMKTYRDWARAKRNVRHPEIIVPETAHAAFDKAGHYFGIKMVQIPVDDQFRADVAAARRAVNRNTIAIVASAPSFPHGILDPVAELAALAEQQGIGCHVDACLGGFILPWAARLGYDIPHFDFRVPGVTSMSADTHKYGYAAKGTSVVLYRGRELRHFQYYTITDWPGGLYFSPTFAGSRPGALSAACWAAMVSIGEAGYMEATRRILRTGELFKQAIGEIPELQILGNPLWVIAFRSPSLNIYSIMEQMAKRGWSLNGLHKPSCLHIALTLRHTQPAVAERFAVDLQESVAYVKEHPDETGEMAPVYGLAATLPLRGVISDILKRYIDLLYKV